MPFDPSRHHRRSIRLPSYDYASPGAYFLTVCAQGRECLFASITEGVVQAHPPGQIVEAAWLHLPRRFPSLKLDVAVVMPNHWHGIVWILPEEVSSAAAGDSGEAGEDRKDSGSAALPAPAQANRPRDLPLSAKAPGPALGQVVAFFKYQTTRSINALRGTPGRRVWQRNYHEHVIRNDESLERLRQYIAENPLRWEQDQLHPDNPSRW